MYLAGAAVVALPGGAATKTVPASVAAGVINAKWAVLNAFGLAPVAEGKIPCGKALWQQFWPQPVPAI